MGKLITCIVKSFQHPNLIQERIYTLQFETAKQTSRGQSNSTRGNFVKEDRRNDAAIYKKLLKDLKELITKQNKTENRTFRRKNGMRCWRCDQEGRLQSRCRSSAAPEDDQDQENSNQLA